MSEIDIALKVIDYTMSLTQRILDYMEEMKPIKATLQQAKAEGRSLNQGELDALKARSDELDAKLRAYLGLPPAVEGPQQ